MRLVRAALALSLATPVALAAQAPERLHVAIVGQAARAHTARLGVVIPERDIALRGLDAEFWLRARGRGARGLATRDGLGFALRLHQSTLGGDDLAYFDASVLQGLGALVERIGGAGVRDAVGDLAAEVAVGTHAGFERASGLAHGEMHTIARVGLRAATRLMPSPLTLEARLSGYLPLGGPSGDDALSGFEGETALRWSFIGQPFDVAIGYRLERMRVYQAAQEASSLRLEVGWRGRP